jgi:hypothetical protein
MGLGWAEDNACFCLLLLGNDMIQKWERNLPGSKLDQNSEIAKTNAV